MHAAITYYFKKQIFYMNRTFPDAKSPIYWPIVLKQWNGGQTSPGGPWGSWIFFLCKTFLPFESFWKWFCFTKGIFNKSRLPFSKADFLIWLVSRARESESCWFRLVTEWAFFRPLGMIHFFPTRENSFLHNKLSIDHGRTGEEGLILNTCVSVVFCLWSWLRVG